MCFLNYIIAMFFVFNFFQFGGDYIIEFFIKFIIKLKYKYLEVFIIENHIFYNKTFILKS